VIIELSRVRGAQLPRDSSISAITLAELGAGPHATDDPIERRRRIGHLRQAESLFETLPFDVEAARHYGPVCGALKAVNRAPRGRTADLQIACVAIANRLPLFTANPKDFAGLEQLLEVIPVSVY
jgi:predicted nucleic acid-binding protein